MGSSFNVKYLYMIILTYIETYVSYFRDVYFYVGPTLFLKYCHKFIFYTYISFCTLKFFIMSYLPYIFWFNWKYLVPDTFCLVTTRLYYVYIIPFLINIQFFEFIAFIKASFGYWLFGYLFRFLIYFGGFVGQLLLNFVIYSISFCFNQVYYFYSLFWIFCELFSIVKIFYFYVNALYDIYNDLCYTFCPEYIMPNFYFTLSIVMLILYDFEKLRLCIILIYFLIIVDYYIWIYIIC